MSTDRKRRLALREARKDRQDLIDMYQRIIAMLADVSDHPEEDLAGRGVIASNAIPQLNEDAAAYIQIVQRTSLERPENSRTVEAPAKSARGRPA